MTPAFVERGVGPVAVVFLHGVGGGKGAWGAQLEAFAARGYRAIAWDMPGYGESATLAPYTMAGLADALGALLAQIDAARAVIVGHSMGGMVAQEAWLRMPARIAGLVLVATSPAFGKPEGDWQQQFLAARLAPLERGVPMRAIATELMGSMVERDVHARALAIELMSTVPPATYRAALGALLGFDRRALLGTITVPTLLVAGATDSTAPTSVMAKMAERIAGAEFVVLPEAGHLANLESPAAFNASVLDFLGKHFQ